jgi:hypothetical protein
MSTRSSLTIEQVLTLLTETPPRIAALTSGLKPAQLYAASSQGEWSANDVLAHLRSCADVWGSCIEVILDQEIPTIRAINPRTWIKKTDYLELKFQLSLHIFATQRAELLAVLEPLAPEDWLLAATVTGGGKPRKQTVHNYARRLALHERTHVNQIKRIVNTIHV